jgi:hypothetical protein
MFVEFGHNGHGYTNALWISDHIIHTNGHKLIISCTSMCNLPLCVASADKLWIVPRFSLDQVSAYAGIKPYTWVDIDPGAIGGFDDFCNGLY